MLQEDVLIRWIEELRHIMFFALYTTSGNCDLRFEILLQKIK